MKKYTKDVLGFTGSSMMLGIGSIAAGSVGGGAGLATMSRFMPAMGSLVTMKHSVRLLGKAKKELNKW